MYMGRVEVDFGAWTGKLYRLLMARDWMAILINISIDTIEDMVTVIHIISLPIVLGCTHDNRGGNLCYSQTRYGKIHLLIH
jgi:hypothetical protein